MDATILAIVVFLTIVNFVIIVVVCGEIRKYRRMARNREW